MGLGLLVACAAVADVQTAGAHSCAQPVTVVQGQETTVQIGITVGDEGADSVTFEFGPGFKLTPHIQRRGWTVEQETDVIRFSDGRLEPNTCELFDVSLRAGEAGTFRVRAFQRLGAGDWTEHPPNGDVFIQPDGSNLVVNHDGPPNSKFEQIVTVTASSDDAGAPTAIFVVAGLAALVVVALLLPLRGSRRRQAS